MLMHTLVSAAIGVLETDHHIDDGSILYSCYALEQAALSPLTDCLGNARYDFSVELIKEYVRVSGALELGGFSNSGLSKDPSFILDFSQNYRMEMLYYFYMSQSPMDGME